MFYILLDSFEHLLIKNKQDVKGWLYLIKTDHNLHHSKIPGKEGRKMTGDENQWTSF